MAMTEALNILGEKIVAGLAGSAIGHSIAFDQLTVTVQAEKIVEIVKYLRDEPSLRFINFTDVTAVDISDVVGNISVPTTIIVGDADKVEPEAVLRREFGSRIKNTEFVVLPGVGHLPPLEAPNELAAAISKAVSRSL